MSNAADLVIALQRVKPVPTTLLVSLEGEDEPKRIAVPNVRKRWHRVEAVLEQLRWRSVEALDKAGNVLAVLSAEEDSGPAPASTSSAGLTIREREIADVVLLSFKQAHTMFMGMFGTLLGSINKQLEGNAQVSRNLTASYERLLHVQRETMEIAAGEAGDDSGLGQVVQMLVTREMHKMAGKVGTASATPPKKSAPNVRKPTDGK
jgi:hypothetical protein